METKITDLNPKAIAIGKKEYFLKSIWGQPRELLSDRFAILDRAIASGDTAKAELTQQAINYLLIKMPMRMFKTIN